MNRVENGTGLLEDSRNEAMAAKGFGNNFVITESGSLLFRAVLCKNMFSRLYGNK